MITKLDDLEVLFSSAKESAPLMQVIQQACLDSAIFLQYIRKTAKTFFLLQGYLSFQLFLMP